MALQSGLKSELTWALNTLTLLSFKEKDDMRKDATPLAKIPGLLDALLQVVRATNFVLVYCLHFIYLFIYFLGIKMFEQDLLNLFLYMLSILILCGVIN